MGNIEICPACNRGFGLFRWRYNCDFCNRVYCSDCLRKPTFQKLTNSPIKIADYCPQCWDSIAQPAIAQYEKALTNYSKVEIFSCKYKGHIPRDMSFTPIQLKTDFFSDRDNAENALKTDAAFLNCDIVYDVTIEKDTDSEPTGKGNGRHHYSVWSMSGKATKRK